MRISRRRGGAWSSFWSASITRSGCTGAGLSPAGRVRANRVGLDSSFGGGGGMSFLRHEEIYRSDRRDLCWSGARSGRLHAPTHRLDEFPAGYSLAGCAPAEPASASPVEKKFTMKAAPQASFFQRTGKTCLAGCLTVGGHCSRCDAGARPAPIPGAETAAAVVRKCYSVASG